MFYLRDAKALFAKLITHAPKAYMFFDIIGDMLGKTPPTNAPEKLKGVYGILGKEDERQFGRLLLELEAEELQLLEGFLHWHFIRFRDRSKVGAITAWWFMNAWRAHVTKLSSENKEIGTSESKTNSTDATTNASTEVKTATKVYSAGGDESLNFLKKVAELIKSSPSPEEGYEAVLEHFKAAGVPHMPDEDTIKWMEDHILNFTKWKEFIKSKINQLNNVVDQRCQEIDTREAARSGPFGWLVGFLYKIM
jgi:hypothetical protein